jgi:hypothetical protein
MTLSDLMSRWTMPASWARASASATWIADLDRRREVQLAPPDELAHGRALDVLHRDEEHPVHFVDLVDVRDGGVVDGGGGARLLHEPAPAVLVADLLRHDDLERTERFETGVAGAVHHAHPALPSWSSIS